MVLHQTTMRISSSNEKDEWTKPKFVMLWKEVGLCIHKGEHIRDGSGYIISHYNSGKSILKHIKTRLLAKQYLQRIYDEVMEDWTFTLEGWKQVSDEDKKKLKILLDKIQKEILMSL